MLPSTKISQIFEDINLTNKKIKQLEEMNNEFKGENEEQRKIISQ